MADYDITFRGRPATRDNFYRAIPHPVCPVCRNIRPEPRRYVSPTENIDTVDTRGDTCEEQPENNVITRRSPPYIVYHILYLFYFAVAATPAR